MPPTTGRKLRRRRAGRAGWRRSGTRPYSRRFTGGGCGGGRRSCWMSATSPRTRPLRSWARSGPARCGSARRCGASPPKRRVVATVMPWAAQAVQQYMAEVRPRYGCGAHPAVWLTERAARISARQVDDRFAQLRALAGLPAELSVHCLRHSYVSHLIEDGADPLFVQQQVGHEWASTTAAYTTVGADARNRMLRSALARAYGEEDGER